MKCLRFKGVTGVVFLGKTCLGLASPYPGVHMGTGKLTAIGYCPVNQVKQPNSKDFYFHIYIYVTFIQGTNISSENVISADVPPEKQNQQFTLGCIELARLLIIMSFLNLIKILLTSAVLTPPRSFVLNPWV